MVVGKPCLLTIFYNLLRASFCAVIACERARLVSKMVLISGGGPTPLVGVGTCDVFCLPTLLLSCIKPVFLSVYERLVLQNNIFSMTKKKIFFYKLLDTQLKQTFSIVILNPRLPSYKLKMAKLCRNETEFSLKPNS